VKFNSLPRPTSFRFPQAERGRKNKQEHRGGANNSLLEKEKFVEGGGAQVYQESK